jgi:prevent-host-death family protein
MTTWQLQEAKNKLSELIDRAMSEGPQVITRHGVEVVVVMPYAGYKKLHMRKQLLGDFLMSSPLHKSGIVLERNKQTKLRDISL